MSKEFFLVWLKELSYVLTFLAIIGAVLGAIAAISYFFGPVGCMILLLLAVTFCMAAAEVWG